MKKNILSKQILSVRFYDALSENLDKNRPKVPDGLTERYSILLKNTGLLTPGYDHIYIYFSKNTQHGEIVFIKRNGRVVEFFCGIDSSKFDSESEQLVENFYTEILNKVMIFLSKVDGLNSEIIENAYKRMNAEKDQLKVEIKTVVSKVHKATISISIAKKSLLHLEVIKLETGSKADLVICTLKDPRDYHILVSRLSIQNDNIVITPRQTPEGILHFRNYYSLDLFGKGWLNADYNKIVIPIVEENFLKKS